MALKVLMASATSRSGPALSQFFLNRIEGTAHRSPIITKEPVCWSGWALDAAEHAGHPQSENLFKRTLALPNYSPFSVLKPKAALALFNDGKRTLAIDALQSALNEADRINERLSCAEALQKMEVEEGREILQLAVYNSDLGVRHNAYLKLMELGDHSFVPRASSEFSRAPTPSTFSFIDQVALRAQGTGRKAQIASQLLLAIAEETTDSRLKALVIENLASAPNGETPNILDLCRSALGEGGQPDKHILSPNNYQEDRDLHITQILTLFQLGTPSIRRRAIDRLEEMFNRAHDDAELRSNILFPFSASGFVVHEEAEAFMYRVMRKYEDQTEGLIATIGHLRALSSGIEEPP